MEPVTTIAVISSGVALIASALMKYFQKKRDLHLKIKVGDTEIALGDKADLDKLIKAIEVRQRDTSASQTNPGSTQANSTND